MPLVRPEKPANRRLTPSLELASATTLTFVALPNNNFFHEFIWTFIEKAQALVASAAQVALAPEVEARDNIKRPLKPRNPNLYYGHLYMECYYFCQQYKNYFTVVRLLGYKRILFATSFLKNLILN